MNPADLAAAPLSELLSTFRLAAIRHSQASESGRHRVANRAYDELTALSGELQSRNPQALVELLSDPEPSVRLAAAADVLVTNPEAAERVLRELAEGPSSPLRLSAEMMLRHWRQGRW